MNSRSNAMLNELNNHTILCFHRHAVLGRRMADRLGICLSGLCVIHCLLTPLLFIFLPSVQLLEFHETFHRVLLLALPLLALLAFVPGYLRHRDPQVFAWSLPGFGLLVALTLAFEGTGWIETALSVTGSLLLIQAHRINRRLCACCETGHGHSRSTQRPGFHRFRSLDASPERLLTRPIRRRR